MKQSLEYTQHNVLVDTCADPGIFVRGPLPENSPDNVFFLSFSPQLILQYYREDQMD